MSSKEISWQGNMSEQEVKFLQNKFKLWKILHSGEKTHYCVHCKYNPTKFTSVGDGELTCSGQRKMRELVRMGFCHVFLLEGNYVK